MRARRRGLSVRVKLALSYAGFLTLAGAALFVVGLLMLRYVPTGVILERASGQWVPDRDDLIEVFVKYTWWALLALAVVGLVGGWLLAGRMLAPLTRITGVVRSADGGSLDRRISLPGRHDELTELADAFDGMLDRIQRTVDEERRFAANASHELRTPHAVIRTIVEVARADPDGRDVDEVLSRIAITNDRAIASTEALLDLARATRADLDIGPVDLEALVGEIVSETDAVAAASGRTPTTLPELHLDLHPATALGSAPLIRQLVANLVSNAVRHNLASGGSVDIATYSPPEGAVLEVSNTGAVLRAELAATLTEPFVRAAGRVRQSGDDGVGLGLTIAAAIVRTHGGTMRLTAPSTGGLSVRVVLPAS